MFRIRHSLLAVALLVGAAALAAAPVTAAPERYKVDLSHSALMFRVKHLNLGFTYGRFNDFAGTIVVDEANPAASSVEITAQVNSVDTNDAKRDQHLKSPDFFSANQFPTMTYKSTSVSREPNGSYKIVGNLTLHGVTKPVAITMLKIGEGDDPWGNHRIGFEGAMTIKRGDFGMDKMMQAVGNTIWITVAVEGIRE